jgi:membrane protease YdiL (CAAX protease family)
MVDQGAGEEYPAFRWGFGAFLLVEAIWVVSAMVLVAIFGSFAPGKLSPVALLVVMAVPTIIAAAAAVLVTIVRGNGPVLDLRLRVRWSDIRVGFKLGLAGLVLTYVAALVWTKWVGQDAARSAVGSVVSQVRLPPLIAVLVFLQLCLLAPLCEEIIYRGLVWGAMRRMQWSRWAAFVLSTAIFAVAHLEPARTPLLLVISVPIGLARLVTGRLAASVVAHAMNNFLPALGILLMALGVMPP